VNGLDNVVVAFVKAHIYVGRFLREGRIKPEQVPAAMRLLVMYFVR
jgi:hypothetical protein